MNSTPPNVSENQDIDLSQISKKIGQSFDRFLSWIFRGLLFVKKNIILFLLLVIAGVAVGYYLDRTSVSYNNELILLPNFGSTEYTYAKVDLVNSKILQGDTLFLKSIGITNPKLFTKVSLVPITDIYNFINDNNKNFELIKLMAEDGDINTIIENETTSKNYDHHILKIRAKTIVKKADIDAFMNYLNDSEYFSKIQSTSQQNIRRRIEESEKTVATIDLILSNFSQSSGENAKNDKLIYYNENSKLGEVFETRNTLITEIANKKVELLNSDKIIKVTSSVFNVKNTKSIGGNFKLIIPLVFILLFVLIRLFGNFYRKQTLLHAQN